MHSAEDLQGGQAAWHDPARMTRMRVNQIVQFLLLGFIVILAPIYNTLHEVIRSFCCIHLIN